MWSTDRWRAGPLQRRIWAHGLTWRRMPFYFCAQCLRLRCARLVGCRDWGRALPVRGVRLGRAMDATAAAVPQLAQSGRRCSRHRAHGGCVRCTCGTCQHFLGAGLFSGACGVVHARRAMALSPSRRAAPNYPIRLSDCVWRCRAGRRRSKAHSSLMSCGGDILLELKDNQECRARRRLVCRWARTCCNLTVLKILCVAVVEYSPTSSGLLPAAYTKK
jgi:hypothetical protein